MSFINKFRKPKKNNPKYTDEESSTEEEDTHLNKIRNTPIPEYCKFNLEFKNLKINKNIVESNFTNKNITSENIVNSLPNLKSEKPNNKMSLTLTLDPLKYIEKLNTFDGRREDLYTFIINIDGIIPTLEKYNDQSQQMCINILKSKLIGKAKRCIEIHAHLTTWVDIKALLISNFGGFKSSFQLYDELRQTPYKGSVMNFYNDIQRTLCELNQKTIREEKQSEIPHNTETALNIFKERLPVHMRTVLFALKPSNLQEALHELTQAGFIDDKSELTPKKLLETPKVTTNPKHYQNQNNFIPKSPIHNKPPFNHNPNPNYKGNNYNPNYKPPSRQHQPMDIDPTSSQLKKVTVNYNEKDKNNQDFSSLGNLSIRGDNKLPFVKLEKNNQTLRLLIDTGATNSLINNEKAPTQFIKTRNSPLEIKTVGTPIFIDKELIIPKEKFIFHVKEDCIFQIYNFNDHFDGLIGNNILFPNNAEINFKSKILKLNNQEVPLFFSKEEESEYQNEISHLEKMIPDSTLFENLEQQRIDHLNDEERKSLMKLLKENKNVFYHKGDDLSFTNHVKHKISTTNEEPIFTRIYRYPEVHKKEVDKQIKDLLDQKIIKTSTSPYNAPIWVVPKKQDKEGHKEWRIVIDYRKLNNSTKEDKFPIPLIDDILDKLGRANYFTTLDLTKGFHQIEVEPEDQEKTAFSTLSGHYEWQRMPFGLKNAPATFQRMMNEVLKDFVGKICYVYLDDIIVFSTSLEEHINSLKKIFEQLQRVNLKVSLNKCDFLKKESEFLGHVVTQDGIKPNPNKIQAIKHFPIPKTIKEIQSFLGLTGYYRKFIQDYAKIIKPMTLCLKKDKKINTKDLEYKEAFEKLKLVMTDNLLNRHPDFNKEFTLTTDASNYAIGAVLSQSHGPLCFASRTLNKHEQNYSTIEKELLAIVWATKQFRHYLYGRKFKILTDHRPLAWLQNLREPNSKLQRWKIKLEEYDFQIEYLAGKENKVADALSRIKLNEINALELVSTQHSNESDSSNLIPITEKPLNVFIRQIIVEKGEQDDEIITFPFNKRRIKIIRKNFLNKNDFDKIISESDTNHRNAIFMKDDRSFLDFQNYWKNNNNNQNLVRTKTFLEDIYELPDMEEIIYKVHNEFNHIGIEKLYLELKRKYYYPNLKTIITKITNNCDLCNLKIERNPIKLPYEKTETPNGPHIHYHIDIWILPNNNKYLTCIDKFSKFASAEKVKSKNQKDILNALEKTFSYMSHPERITLDNDPTFKTYSIKNYFQEKQILTHFSTPYRHTGNSDVERLHSTFNEHIRLLEKTENIFDLVVKTINIYNKTVHLTTKEKPIDIHLGKIDNKIVFSRIEKTKIKVLEKLNKNRIDTEIDPNFTKINNPENFNKLKTKHKKVKVIKVKEKKILIKPHLRKQTLHKDQFRKRKKHTKPHNEDNNSDSLFNNPSEI